MRIGEVAARTGLSARVIRSYEARGWLRPAQAGAGHRHYAAADVERARLLRALLAADVAPELAVRAVDGRADAAERDEVRAALTVLADQVRAALAATGPPSPDDDDAPERHISLMFDTFVARTRMESVLTEALRPAGVPSGEYAIISLIDAEGAMTPATVARLVGAAPSTLGGRIASLARRGLVRRTPDPADRRSWRLELTPSGIRTLLDAIPYGAACATRIDDALLARGTHPDTIRDALHTLSAALRSLLPDRPGT